MSCEICGTEGLCYVLFIVSTVIIIGPDHFHATIQSCLGPVLVQTKRREPARALRSSNHATTTELWTQSSLYCLQISFRLDFKILLITFKALYCHAPEYIMELRILRSRWVFLAHASRLAGSECLLSRLFGCGTTCLRNPSLLLQYLLLNHLFFYSCTL